MSEASPKLLSLLDQIVNPVERVQIQLDVHGVYAFPEEWKNTDDSNPNLFTYQAKMQGLDITSGKVLGRQLTEKEIKEQEELAAQKGKAKAGKKDAKQEVQISAEEEEALKKKQEQEEEEERKRLEEWNKLDEQTKFYRTAEDKYKTPSLQFEMKVQEGSDLKGYQARSVKEGQNLVFFEERVYDDKGDWIYFVKQPSLTEDELAKLKKGKPKNLNINDLNPVTMRAWVNLGAFAEPGTSVLTQRCKLEQIQEDLANQDIPKPNLEHTYILITIKLDVPICPLITEIQPKLSDLIPRPPPIPKISPAKECILEFRNELQLAMESLAIEYSQQFSKELSQNNDSKAKNVITVQKKQDIQKRKETFLYDFNVMGKYKVLKERLKKSIVRICRDKFQKQGSITGITTDQKDQFYSELYVFLMEQTRQTLHDLIDQKKEELHEDIVISYEQTKKERDRILQHITKETDQDRMLRLANEYEMLNQMELAEKNYRDLIKFDDRSAKNYFKYTKFLLVNQDFSKAEQMLENALSFDLENREYQLLMASLLLRRSRPKEASVILKNLTQLDPANLLYNTLYSFLYQKFLKEEKLGEKYKRVAERIYQRKHNLIQAKNSHKKQPNPFEIPTFKPISQAEYEQNKPPSLEKDEWDEIYIEMIEYLCQNNLFDLAERSKELVQNEGTNRYMKINCQILQFRAKDNKDNYSKCITLLDKMLEATNNEKSEKIKKREIEDLTTMKANICYLSDKLYESEDIFLKALKLKGNKKPDLSIYLRLGNIYLKRKSWGDAKAIFVRACELKNNSSLSWLGLGQACLRIGQYKEAEEALTQGNIYDPFNGDIWGNIALLCLKDNGRFNQANQALRELFKTDCYDLDLLEELGDDLANIKQNETSEKLYLKVIDTAQKNKLQTADPGILSLKLGQVYLNLRQYQQAVVCFDEAIQQIDGEQDKNSAINLRKQASNYIDNNQYDY